MSVSSNEKRRKKVVRLVNACIFIIAIIICSNCGLIDLPATPKATDVTSPSPIATTSVAGALVPPLDPDPPLPSDKPDETKEAIATTEVPTPTLEPTLTQELTPTPELTPMLERLPDITFIETKEINGEKYNVLTIDFDVIGKALNGKFRDDIKNGFPRFRIDHNPEITLEFVEYETGGGSSSKYALSVSGDCNKPSAQECLLSPSELLIIPLFPGKAKAGEDGKPETIPSSPELIKDIVVYFSFHDVTHPNIVMQPCLSYFFVSLSCSDLNNTSYLKLNIAPDEFTEDLNKGKESNQEYSKKLKYPNFLADNIWKDRNFIPKPTQNGQETSESQDRSEFVFLAHLANSDSPLYNGFATSGLLLYEYGQQMPVMYGTDEKYAELVPGEYADSPGSYILNCRFVQEDQRPAFGVHYINDSVVEVRIYKIIIITEIQE